MKFSKVKIGADRSSLQAGAEMLSMRLDNDVVANQIQCGLFCGPFPTVLR